MGPDRLPSVDELADLVSERAPEPVAAARLHAAIELGRDLTDTGDALIERFVSEARAADLSWTEIGQLFGTSKQAAQKRYGAATATDGRWPGRWTPAAHDALNGAGELARELGHDAVGTEHALVALLATDGAAAHVLADLGITRSRVLARLPGPRGRGLDDCVGVMPRFKQALEHSRRIADGLGHRVAGTEHLLAGILAVPDALAVEILDTLGVSADDARATLAERLQVDARRLRAPRRRRRLIGATR
jgi:hypothetical protein